MAFLASSRPSQPNQSQYLTQMYWYCSAALPQSHFYIRMQNNFSYKNFHFLKFSMHKLSTFFLGFPFRNFIIFFTLVHNFTSSNLL